MGIIAYLRNWGNGFSIARDTDDQLPPPRLAIRGEYGVPAAPTNERSGIFIDPFATDVHRDYAVPRGLSAMFPASVVPSGSGAAVGSITTTFSYTRAVVLDEVMGLEDIKNTRLVLDGGGWVTVEASVELSVDGTSRDVDIQLLCDSTPIGYTTETIGSGTTGTETTVAIASTQVYLTANIKHIFSIQWRSHGDVAKTLYCGVGTSITVADAGGLAAGSGGGGPSSGFVVFVDDDGYVIDDAGLILDGE